MSMFSLAFEPKKSIVSVPSWPSMVSLPSPGSHWKTSSPAPMKATSLPLSPKMKSLPSPPRNTSAPWRAEERVVAGAAVDRQLDDAGGQRGRRHAVVAAQGVDDERVVGPLGVGDVHLGRQPDHGDRGPRAEDVDDVVAVGAVDDDDVGLRRRRPCRRSSPARLMLISTRSVPVRSLTVVVSVPPRVLRSMRLDVVEVHDDVAEVAGEPHAPAVGRGLEDLVAGASR